MKVDVINEKEVLVTKGRLWWKKQAKAYLNISMWYHDKDMTIPVDGEVLVAIYSARARMQRDATAAQQATVWKKA